MEHGDKLGGKRRKNEEAMGRHGRNEEDNEKNSTQEGGESSLEEPTTGLLRAFALKNKKFRVCETELTELRVKLRTAQMQKQQHLCTDRQQPPHLL